jgi:hypothetical protein
MRRALLVALLLCLFAAPAGAARIKDISVLRGRATANSSATASSSA